MTLLDQQTPDANGLYRVELQVNDQWVALGRLKKESIVEVGELLIQRGDEDVEEAGLPGQITEAKAVYGEQEASMAFSDGRTVQFGAEESLTLARLYVQIAEGGEAGAKAESEVVTMLSEKLGEIAS